VALAGDLAPLCECPGAQGDPAPTSSSLWPWKAVSVFHPVGIG
jgi:hypothetical protein